MAVTLKSYRYHKTNGRGHIYESVKSVLVDDSGNKWLRVLMMAESGLTVQQVPKSEARFMFEVMQTKKIASMKTIVKRFRAYGRRVGTTKAASSFLKKASAAQ